MRGKYYRIPCFPALRQTRFVPRLLLFLYSIFDVNSYSNCFTYNHMTCTFRTDAGLLCNWKCLGSWLSRRSPHTTFRMKITISPNRSQLRQVCGRDSRHMATRISLCFYGKVSKSTKHYCPSPRAALRLSLAFWLLEAIAPEHVLIDQLQSSSKHLATAKTLFLDLSLE